MCGLRRGVLVVFLLLGTITWISSEEQQGEQHQGHKHHHQKDARWDHWTEWSPCSTACGNGVTSRSRDCRSMADGSVVHSCHGPKNQTKLCKTEGCIGSDNMNARACSKLDVRVYGGRRYRWNPYKHPSKVCQMACRPVGQGFYLGLDKNVQDGTPCGENGEPQICVGGVCKTYGCDDIVESGSVLDRCGVCNGNGSSCRVINQTFRKSSKHGYTAIATIPAGATHISISELKQARNYLAVRAVDGSFKLNTDFKLSRFGNHPGAGTAFKYSRRDGPDCPGECITAPGPTNIDIEIQGLFYTENPGIKYSFHVPHGYNLDITNSDGSEGAEEAAETGDRKRPIFSYDFKFKNKHGHRDSDGSRREGPVIITSDDSSIRTDATEEEQVVSDNNDDVVIDTPSVHDNADEEEDTYTGIYLGGGNRDRAPLEAGSTGVSEGGGRERTVSGKPNDMYTNDNRERSLYSWRVSGYTECSVTCGEGKQSPIVECIVTNKDRAVMDKYCEDLTKPAIQVLACNYGECPASWKPQRWTKCSVSCGRGVQSRDYVCTKDDDVALDAHDCNTPKPNSDERECDTGSCASGWFFTVWDEQCSDRCGEGVRSRKVHCVTGDSSNSIHSCPERERPEAEKRCRSDDSCGGFWFTGPWSECNATCGMAYQTRSVACVWKQRQTSLMVVSDSRCTGEEKPPAYMSCDLEPCEPEWYLSEFGECSVTCGSGRRSREVRCLDADKRPSPFCSSLTKPSLEEACDNRPCPPKDQTMVKPTDCKDSFRQCTLVLQARLCNFPYYAGICCESCAKLKDNV